jgi:rubrerythrin
MAKTDDDLKEAFAGESQANRKYLAFSKKADQEGYKQVAKLFRAAAEAETVHAHAHLRVAGGVKSTAENLNEALNGESFEFQQMYPKMIEDAKADGNKGALMSFDYANQVEKVHADLYKKAIDDLGKNKETDYHVCQVCGMTVEGDAPDKCPVCGAPKSSFKKVD